MLVSTAVAAIAFFRRSLSGRTFLIGLGVFAALSGLRTAFSPLTTLAYNGPARVAASLTWVVFSVSLPELLLPDLRARRLARKLMAGAILFATIPPAWDGIEASDRSRRAVTTRQGTVFVNRSKLGFSLTLSRSLRPGERALPIPETTPSMCCLTFGSSLR